MIEPELTDEEANRLLRQRIIKASKRVAMLAFSRGEPSSPEEVNNNGTVSFIELPGGKFLVTNHHVWDTFRSCRANDATYKLALTGEGLVMPIDISDAVAVSESQELDLCVLSYPPERIEALGKEFCVPPSWPPARANDADDISMTGYPGMRRTVETMVHPQLNESIPVLWHESVILYLHADGVSSRQARLRFTNPNPEVMQLSNRPITEFRWGGMSGSLVYRLDPNQNRFLPCGILHAAGEGLDAIFYATHLDFIQPDGSIASP